MCVPCTGTLNVLRTTLCVQLDTGTGYLCTHKVSDLVHKECEVCVCAAHTTPKPCCLLKVEIVYILFILYIFIYIWSSIYSFCLSRFLHTCCRSIMYHTHTSLFLVSFYRYVLFPLSDTTYYPQFQCSFIAPLISCAVVFLLPRLFR